MHFTVSFLPGLPKRLGGYWPAVWLGLGTTAPGSDASVAPFLLSGMLCAI